MTPTQQKNTPSDDLILFREGDTDLVLAYKHGVLAKSTRDGVNWRDSNLPRAAMFDPGNDATVITEAEARAIHPNLVLPG